LGEPCITPAYLHINTSQYSGLNVSVDRSNIQLLRSWDNPILGSNHGDELDAFFNGDEVFDPDNQALAVAMRQYWTSFATSGVPVAKESPSWVVSPSAHPCDAHTKQLLG
jgi:carboxylesterase type B